jgi:serine/threonine protein kinase
MGITYKAYDIDLQCPVTLKVISERYLGDESARLRFLREARLAARLRHSNVASVLHLGRTGTSYFYAMEFVEGETLEKLIKRSRQIELKLALEIATQVAAGLSAVHKQKLVHRDIKPSNIMVNVEAGGTLTAKIIDLGLAKSAPDTPADAAISVPGTFAGTPEFASPEQFAGAGVDTRSDLYSLGLVLWVMLTGHVVFSGSPAEVMYKHQHVSLPLEKLEAAPQPVIVLIEWPVTTIALRSLSLLGPSTDRVAVGTLHPQMNFLIRLLLGLEIPIRDSELRGKRAKDWRTS